MSTPVTAGPRSGISSVPGPTLIQAPSGWPGSGLGELWRYRRIAWVLAQRNLAVRYRQTLLGIAWVLVQPLALMLVFSVFFGLLVGRSYYGMPYPVFFLTALTFWLPAMKVISEGTMSLIANQQLVTRVYVPRTLLPASVAIATAVDLFWMLVALAITLLLFSVPITPAILTAPILIAIAYATALGVAYWFSAANVAYRDIKVGLPFIERLWFFTTPLLYPATIVPPEFQPLYYLNPMAVVTEGARWAFAGAPAPPEFAWVEGVSVAAVLLVSGYLFFRKREPTFADVL